MPRVAAIIQARMRSNRLPGKVLKEILGRPVLELFLERLKRARRLASIIVAATEHRDDDPIEALSKRLGHPVFRGSDPDVLDRFVLCARAYPADWIVRVTSDCPAIDPRLVDEAIEAAVSKPGLQLVVNNLPRTYPHGMDVEVVSREALETAWREAEEPREREHVTPFVRERPDRFPQFNLACPEGPWGHLRVTLDTERDLDVLRRLFEDLYPTRPDFTWRDVVGALQRHPEWQAGGA
jgi:spore coat polysaccharide biosynthesis protein SpsF